MIWVIGKAVPRPENNFLGSFEFEQAQTLYKFGENVLYIALDFRPINSWRKFGENIFDVNGMKVFELNLPIRPMPFIQLNVEKNVCKTFFKKIEKVCGFPNIIHVHFPSLINSGIQDIYKKRGSKIVATEHWSMVMLKTLPKWSLQNLKWYVSNADAFLCVSKPLMDSAIQLAGSPKLQEVVPNIISEDFFYDSNIQKQSFSFVAIGRLVKGKRFDILIKAFCKAFKNDEIVLKIIGYGEEKENLEKIIEELNLGDRIFLLGKKNRNEVADELRNSHVLVSSSIVETFCVPVIEALACGVPVVIDKRIGCAEFIDEKCGVIDSLDNVEDLAKALTNIYDNISNYNPVEISAHAMERFSEYSIFQKLNKIYKSL